ncbi:MAG: hypothetical protein HYV26_23390 [Candidatus Hydrogenedentes bacterium]|nr:hypothetical protein [Candidatus Hydrogenedentota bacterium]
MNVTIVVLGLLMAADTAVAGAPPAATVVVAAADSAEKSRAMADFTGDGAGDQEEINAAVQALPPAGGTVMLMEGTYDIRRVDGTLGGVLIDRSHVTLAGQGPATKLVQAPGQETNVIRIIGSGVGNVTVRDLWVDAHRDANPVGEGDPNVSHARFEFCGIKAYCQAPGGPGCEPCHDISIQGCHVLNARRLGIMLEGPNMRVLDNVLGNALSDSVEILTGPGIIRGNYVEITGKAHVAIGSDRADNMIMSDNIVHVKKGGDLDIGFRSWADSHRHVLSGNVLMVEPEGQCARAMDIRGFGAVVTGNNVYTAGGARLLLEVAAGNTLITSNVFENVDLLVNDQTPVQLPILIQGNLLTNSSVKVEHGSLHPSSDVKQENAGPGNPGEEP